MAVAYVSNQTANSATTTLTITKPTSLAVGDLMVGFIIGALSGGGDPSGPSNWIKLNSIPNIGASGQSASVWYIVATSTEVAATNFSWTGFDNAPAFNQRGWIARYTGASTTAPIDQHTMIETGVGPGLTGTGITPTQANSLFVMSVFWEKFNSARTVSGYAIVTDNPTWTEQFDGGATSSSIAMATGPRSQVTASGSPSATLSTAAEASALSLFNIVPPSTGGASFLLNFV